MKRIYLLLLLSLIAMASVNAQEIIYSSVPVSLQLYPRDTKDSAVVAVKGNVIALGYDSIILKSYVKTILKSTKSAKLNYGMDNKAAFNLTYTMHADTVMYKFEISLRKAAIITLKNKADSVVCGDVFLTPGRIDVAKTISES